MVGQGLEKVSDKLNRLLNPVDLLAGLHRPELGHDQLLHKLTQLDDVLLWWQKNGSDSGVHFLMVIHRTSVRREKPKKETGGEE